MAPSAHRRTRRPATAAEGAFDAPRGVNFVNFAAPRLGSASA